MSEPQLPIIVVQEFEAPLSVVWRAITDPARMREWFFATIGEFEPKPEFEARFNVHVEDSHYEHIWRIREVVPEQQLVYGWRYEGIPGDSSVHWELAATPSGTRLTFTHEFHDPFPQNDPNFTREAGEQGWDYFIRQSLKTYVDGTRE